MCGIFARLPQTKCTLDVLAQARRASGGGRRVAAGAPEHVPEADQFSRSVLGISIPMADFPGIGRQDPDVGAGHGVGDVLATAP